MQYNIIQSFRITLNHELYMLNTEVKLHGVRKSPQLNYVCLSIRYLCRASPIVINVTEITHYQIKIQEGLFITRLHPYGGVRRVSQY
jgi:hypothetical protein